MTVGIQIVLEEDQVLGQMNKITHQTHMLYVLKDDFANTVAGVAGQNPLFNDLFSLAIQYGSSRKL